MKITRAKRTSQRIGEAKLRPLKPGVIPIDEWYPDENTPTDTLVGFAGKTMYVPFDKLLQRDTIQSFNVFDLSLKEAYYKQLDTICNYINYFELFYDTDRELIMAYLRLKWIVDTAETESLSRKSFIEWMNSTLFTESMCKKIVALTSDNYRVDLETDNQKKRGSKIYPEALQFNEHHAEIFMRISVAIKFAIPIVMHYIKIFHGKNEPKNHLHEYFMWLFKNPLLVEDVNILGKLRHTIAKRVNSYSKPDRSIYSKHEAIGSSTETFIDDLFHKNIITDTVFNYRFSGNTVSFNSVVLRYQLIFHSKEDLKMDFHEVTAEKEPEGLSGLDKLEMYTTKVDSFALMYSQVNINDTIRRLQSKIKIDITDEEIDYYKENYDFNGIGGDLLRNFFAKYFGGFRDVSLLKRRQHILCLIIMKRMLEARGLPLMSMICSANANGHTSSRVIRNQKFLEKVCTSPKYIKLMEKKYPSLANEKDSPVIVLLSRLLNSKWTICDADADEHLGEILVLDDDKLSYEFLEFVDCI